MTNRQDNAELTIKHVALTAAIDRDSDAMAKMETAGESRLSRYVETEQRWARHYDERDAIDDAFLSLPITDHWQIAYKADVIHRIVDFEPERADDLWGRHAYQVEAWACRCSRMAA
jgi:hypothetical protein